MTPTQTSSQNRDLQIAVIGGGVVGMCSGLALQQEFPLAKVSILSDRWTPNTTGDVSGGLIYPSVLVGEKTSPSLVERIFKQSVLFYTNLLQNYSAGQYGVSLITMYELFAKEVADENSLASQYLPFHRKMNKFELVSLFPNANNARSGTVSTTFIAEPTLLLPFLMEKFKSKGGKLITQKIDALGPLTTEYDLVINCTGLSARYLADVQDDDLQSARGQVIRVQAPWIRHAVFNDQYYIIPNTHCVVLGGTKQMSDYNLSVDPTTAENILQGCTRLIPSLSKAKKLVDCVGLRPYRSAIRIEIDHNLPNVIHNYGHGGSGVTLCWGSAMEVVTLAHKVLASANNIKAKL